MPSRMAGTVYATAGWLLIWPTTPGSRSEWIGETSLTCCRYSMYGIMALVTADSKNTGKVMPSTISAVLRIISTPRCRWRR